MTLEDYTLRVENKEEQLALELNCRFTMLTWRHFSKDSGLDLSSLESTDPMVALDVMAWLISSSVKAYNAKYKTEQVCSFEDAYELIPMIGDEEITGFSEAIAESRMIKSLLPKTTSPEVGKK